MLSSGYNNNIRENFVKIKMEEQTVPSAGFSPQPEYMATDCGSNNYYGVMHHHQHQANGQQQPHSHNNQHHHPQQQQQPQQQMQSTPTINGCLDYSNLAESFDLSLLGDTYDDKDMATVPSPSSWSPLGALESNAWQQMSFYAASPPEFRAFSPDCKPFRGEQQSNTKNSSNTVPPNNGSGTNTPSQQMLDVMAYPTNGTAAAAVSNGANVTTSLSTVDHDACNRNNILLRQCLEDNTFIEKYNFKPLDLPITSLPNDVEATMDNAVPTGATNVVGSTTLELNQIEPVFNLAYEQFISDMQNTCRTLAISPDPMQWSVEDVQSWLCYSLTSFSHERGTNPSSATSPATNTATSNAIRALWNIDGQRLCSLIEEDFRRRDPLNGEKIFANLELLKMWKCSAEFQQSFTQHQQQSNVNSSQPEPNGQAQQPFDLGQILLAAGAATAGGNGAYSNTGSPVSSMEHSPAPSSSFVDDIKVELEDSPMQQANQNQAKFSNPSSVDTASSSSSSMRQSDDDDDEDEEEEKPAPGGGGKSKACGTKNGAHIHLWQFLKELLASGQQHGSCIRWLDQSRGVFKIEDSVRVARLWGIRKNRPAMNYDKLSRSIRQYYRKGIMRKTERSQRLVYQFCHPYGL